MKATKTLPGRKTRLLSGAFSLLAGVNRKLILSALLIAAVFVAARMAWQTWGGAVQHHPSFVLTAENIVVTPQPDWVHVDVKAEVIRDGTLEKLQLLDSQVTVKVARAFAVHTWVASVTRVSKQAPARIIVEVEYRQPVAMVEVKDNGEPGLVPVDKTGFVLPPDGFAEKTRNYLRIFGGETVPAGPVGTSWGDERVVGGASIASALANSWKKLDLYRICVAADSLTNRKGNEIVYELYTKDQFRIIWGHAPGFERGNEASASEKVLRLLALVEKNGPFSAENHVGYDISEKAGISLLQKHQLLQNEVPFIQKAARPK